ncbi:thioesterase II family protein [Kibdelosporangium phytohabitans]|uniref:Thioesterase n=1 Tax=Kibdelosporangium phytohabitans TaxID=860235 RepID=A0A0N9I4Y3_9PSEU|nr:alpha/beta fold hydrolase [Kibdelosporangium phytohabitans]ALG10940.1 thioesterase [Kibdelosporangium phytohabitans]MBE1462141.1 surfactin synthase thioesterase subunit [Kibdelosporangium phytohabitans]
MTTLVCLPFAGVGASFFHPWSVAASDRLRVVAPQLPGRERRIDEEPYRDVHAAVDGLLHDLLGQLPGGRVALFGHSLGAVLAYELAHRLVNLPGVEVVRLFASGSTEPHTPRPGRATGLDDDEFVDRVRQFAGFSDEALDDEEMRELILPTLRADVQMHESYVPSTELPLPAPVTALRGDSDELVSADQAAGWAKATSKDFTFTELPGGHMYLTTSAPAVVRLIEDATCD